MDMCDHIIIYFLIPDIIRQEMDMCDHTIIYFLIPDIIQQTIPGFVESHFYHTCMLIIPGYVVM